MLATASSAGDFKPARSVVAESTGSTTSTGMTALIAGYCCIGRRSIGPAAWNAAAIGSRARATARKRRDIGAQILCCGRRRANDELRGANCASRRFENQLADPVQTRAINTVVYSGNITHERDLFLFLSLLFSFL